MDMQHLIVEKIILKHDLPEVKIPVNVVTAWCVRMAII